MVNFLGYDIAISELCTVAVSLFLAVFYAVKTGNVKNLIKEVSEMKYKFRTEQTVEPSKGQEFPETKPVYRLNKATGELEQTDEVVNLQEIINSCIDTALDRALDRLMPKVQVAEDIAELDTMREDLDFAMQACDLAEDYREKYNLPASYSVNEIYNHVAKEAEILKAKIETAQSMNKPKEEVQNETEKAVENDK